MIFVHVIEESFFYAENVCNLNCRFWMCVQFSAWLLSSVSLSTHKMVNSFNKFSHFFSSYHGMSTPTSMWSTEGHDKKTYTLHPSRLLTENKHSMQSLRRRYTLRVQQWMGTSLSWWKLEKSFMDREFHVVNLSKLLFLVWPITSRRCDGK